MPTPGYVFRDGGPIPDDELEEQAKESGSTKPGETHASSIQQDQNAQKTPQSPTSPTTQSRSQPQSPASPTSSNVPSNHASKLLSNVDDPTDSHTLAVADHDEKGVAQQEHFEAEVKDLGWRKPKDKVSEPLVGGIDNEELWLLIRRFNKQMYHAKATNKPILAGLDLNIADEDEFSPDKLRANVERLYMTVIVGFMSFGKHIARLRSWREPRRTGAFAAVYFVAWILDLIMPLLFATMTALVLVPRSRALLFPPAPIALIDSKTGGVKTPKAGVLGSHDTLTGAPENHKGEAAEKEASNFVSGIGTIALSSATGKHESDEDDDVGKNAPDPTKLASAGADAKAAAQGHEVSKAHDKTKQPMEDAMWAQMRPVMHIVGDIADTWERFANALSPTSPFSKIIPKLKLASLVAPGIAIAMATSSYAFIKMNLFFVGFGFFGDPVIQRGVTLLNQKFPHWMKLLELRNSILKGVPTNAQLTITLLRIGEAHKAPLPPPPRTDAAPADEAADLDTDDLMVDASHEEIQEAISPTEPSEDQKGHDGVEPAGKKKRSALMGMLKGTTKAGVETKLGSDSVRAAVGSAKAKDHRGVLPKGDDLKRSGPVDFRARYHGRKGWVHLNTSATIPCVGFSTHKSRDGGDDSDLKPEWSVPIEDIKGLKKVGGFGWKGKLVVGWATNKSVQDGIEIEDKTGQVTKLTAIPLRDELFNRLVSMGGQKWESW